MSDAIIAACPFCKSAAELKRPHGEYFVQCTKVGTCYGKHNNLDCEGYLDASVAIMEWNKRAELPSAWFALSNAELAAAIEAAFALGNRTNEPDKRASTKQHFEALMKEQLRRASITKVEVKYHV